MSWAHKILDKLGVNQVGVDATPHSSMRVSGRPMYLGTRGAYSLSAPTGVMAAGLAANSEIFQFRWTHATRLAIIRSIGFSGGGIVAFAAGQGMFNVHIARGWSADGSGGTAIVFSTANTNKKRTDFPLSSLSDTGVRVASTAALGAGTKTLDTNAFACSSFGVTATAGATLGAPSVPIWQRNTHEEYPLILEQNEGLVIRATVPATGTWTGCVQIEWAEVDPADSGIDWG